MAPVLRGFNLVVRDMDATIAFYRLIGLTIDDDAVWRTASGAHHVEVPMADGCDLDFDSPALARQYNAGWSEAPGGGNVVMSFSIASAEEVDAVYARVVAAGHPSLQPPYTAFWGARFAIVADPDGNHVGLMGPADPARRSPPPGI